MRLFDSHCHLTDPKFDEDREQTIARMRDAGVVGCVLISDPCEEIPNQEAALRLANREPGFVMAIGVHPHNASGWNAESEAVVREYAAKPECTAIGEIGLDYHYDLSPRDIQRDAFARQLDIAFETGMPCQLHIREAFGDAMEILRSAKGAGRLPVCVMHCYSGSWETARECLAMGMYISLSSSVTFKNAQKLIDTVKNAPLDRLLVETDSPYLSPEPLRGRRNEPANVAHTARRVAALRDMEPDALALATLENARRLFKPR